jgi:orotate phosphoribosyltransferase
VQNYQREFVDFLFSCGAFRLGSFKLKSGRISPTFVNTGLVTGGGGIQRLGAAYAGKMLEIVGADGFDAVFGPSYKGVPLAVATAIALSNDGVDKKYLFDRKEQKDHGEEASAAGSAKLIVGHRPEAGDRIMMVDDVLTTGATKYEAVRLLRGLAENVTVPLLVIAVDRQEIGPDGHDACARFTEEMGVPVEPAVRITELLEHLDDTDRLPADDRERCLDYLAEYGTADAKAWVESRRNVG